MLVAAALAAAATSRTGGVAAVWVRLMGGVVAVGGSVWPGAGITALPWALRPARSV